MKDEREELESKYRQLEEECARSREDYDQQELKMRELKL
jgi:hypothetical protein